ncbi:MAG TPA: antibiotic biosynthesis monooxygenase [Patescibacteria group bacterium]|nr:antibiotic biosynthesis monooxygenase [Patescibacteria group bacterium]
MKITEIVTMKTLEGVTKFEFINIVDGLEKNFHSLQPGFIDTELLYNDESEEWCMIQHWTSKENLKEASKKIFTDPAAEAFVRSLDKHSVKMLIFPQLSTWNKQ